MEDVLFDAVFDDMRDYIRYGDLPAQKYRPDFYIDTSLEQKNMHIITFQEENGFITCNVRLFNSFYYKYILGKYPFSIDSRNFGCATAFNPFSREIITTLYSSPSPIIGKPKYGLFCR